MQTSDNMYKIPKVDYRERTYNSEVQDEGLLRQVEVKNTMQIELLREGHASTAPHEY